MKAVSADSSFPLGKLHGQFKGGGYVTWQIIQIENYYFGNIRDQRSLQGEAPRTKVVVCLRVREKENVCMCEKRYCIVENSNLKERFLLVKFR